MVLGLADLRLLCPLCTRHPRVSALGVGFVGSCTNVCVCVCVCVHSLQPATCLPCLLFSSAVGPCAQRESNRRLHGTSPVTQPLEQHPPQPDIRAHSHTPAQHTVPSYLRISCQLPPCMRVCVEPRLRDFLLPFRPFVCVYIMSFPPISPYFPPFFDFPHFSLPRGQAANLAAGNAEACVCGVAGQTFPPDWGGWSSLGSCLRVWGGHRGCRIFPFGRPSIPPNPHPLLDHRARPRPVDRGWTRGCGESRGDSVGPPHHATSCAPQTSNQKTF